MKLLNKLFEFYVFSNLHVSVSVACLVLSVGLLFDVNVHHEAVLLMCATFVSYHFIRFFNRHKYGKTHLLEVFSNHYRNIIYGLLVVATIVGTYELIYLKPVQLLYLLPFVFIILLYAYSFVGLHGSKYSIRFVPGVKIFVIAFVWAGLVVFFPLVSKMAIGFSHFLYFIEMLLFVVVLTLPFDIRDLSFDDKNIKTIPMLLGVVGAKRLGVVLLSITIALHLHVFNQFKFWPLCLVAFLLFLLLLGSKEKQAKYYASFWVEGIPILFYLLLFYF